MDHSNFSYINAKELDCSQTEFNGGEQNNGEDEEKEEREDRAQNHVVETKKRGML